MINEGGREGVGEIGAPCQTTGVVLNYVPRYVWGSRQYSHCPKLCNFWT